MFKIPRRFVAGKTLTAKIDFQNGGNLPAQTLRNGKIVDGRLVDCCDFEFVQNAHSQCNFGDFCLVFAADGVYLEGTERKKVVDEVLQNPCFCYLAKQKTVAISQKCKGTFTFDGQWKKVFDVGFDALVSHAERLFAACGTTLYFSDRANFETWQNVQLPQNALCVASCDKLFVVGDDLFQVDFCDDEKDTKIFVAYKNLGKVHPGTVAAHGKSLYFCADESIFCYNGGKCNKICCDARFSNGLSAAVFDGKYFLAAKDGKQNVLVCIDCKTNVPVCIWNADFSNVFASESLFFACRQGLFRLGSGSADVQWISMPHTFGTYGKKFLRSLSVDTKYPLCIRLATDVETKIYRFEGADYPQKIAICGCFRKLSVAICGVGKTCVSGVEICAKSFEKEVA